MAGDTIDWNGPATLLRKVADDAGPDGRKVDGFAQMLEGSVVETVRFYLNCNEWVRGMSRLVIHSGNTFDGDEIAALATRPDFPG